MKLRVEIAHLTVDAAGPVDAEALRAALVAELTARFAAGGLDPGPGGAVDRVTLRLPATGASLGARLGASVHGAIRQAGGGTRIGGAGRGR